MAKRTRITSESDRRVVLEYTDEAGERVTRTYTVGLSGTGYVYELLVNGGTTQPCTGLYHTGDTLYHRGGPLVDTIRREWRLRQRAERSTRG